MHIHIKHPRPEYGIAFTKKWRIVYNMFSPRYYVVVYQYVIDILIFVLDRYGDHKSNTEVRFRACTCSHRKRFIQTSTSCCDTKMRCRFLRCRMIIGTAKMESDSRHIQFALQTSQVEVEV